MQLTLSTHRNKQMCYQQNIPVLLLILKHPLLALSVVQKGSCLKFQSSHQLPFWRLPRLYECHTFSFLWRKHDNIQNIHNWIFSGNWDEICGKWNLSNPYRNIIRPGLFPASLCAVLKNSLVASYYRPSRREESRWPYIVPAERNFRPAGLWPIHLDWICVLNIKKTRLDGKWKNHRAWGESWELIRRTRKLRLQ